MRHGIRFDSVGPFPSVMDSQSTRARLGDDRDDAVLTEMGERDVAASIHLRDVLPTAKWSDESDFELPEFADSAAEAIAGQWVVYRIGIDDPNALVAQSLARGAGGILTEQRLPSPLPQCIVGDVDLAMASITAARLGRPDRKLLTVGVIGASGKTSTALLAAKVLRDRGIRTAFRTDLGESDGITQTTPKVNAGAGAALVESLGEAVDAECEASIIELREDHARAGGYDAIEFDVLIITHASETKTDYGPCALTCVLERMTDTGVAIAPADDRDVEAMVQQAGVPMVSYGSEEFADLNYNLIDQADGLSTILLSQSDVTAVLESPLAGSVMAANHAAAATLGVLLAAPLQRIAESLGSVRTIPGRGRRISQFGKPTVVIETGVASRRVAVAIASTRETSGGKLHGVVSIGKEDDELTLANIGTLLERGCDSIVLTASKGSKDSFLRSTHAVLDGVKRCAAMRLIADPDEAMRWSMAHAQNCDTVLFFAGRGKAGPHDHREDLRRIESVVESAYEAIESPKFGLVG